MSNHLPHKLSNSQVMCMHLVWLDSDGCSHLRPHKLCDTRLNAHIRMALRFSIVCNAQTMERSAMPVSAMSCD